MRWNCDVLLLLGLLMVSVAGVEESDMVDVTEAAAERVDQDYVDDSEEYVEELPEAEAWGRGKEMDDAVIVDQDRRLVAEQLIQELGEISSKLLDDNSVTIGTTHSISPTDLANVDTLLFNAGLTPRSKLVKNVFRKKDHVVHEDQGTRVPLLVPNMTKKNVEEIKAELQQMLFGTGLKQVNNCSIIDLFINYIEIYSFLLCYGCSFGLISQFWQHVAYSSWKFLVFRWKKYQNSIFQVKIGSKSWFQGLKLISLM